MMADPLATDPMCGVCGTLRSETPEGHLYQRRKSVENMVDILCRDCAANEYAGVAGVLKKDKKARLRDRFSDWLDRNGLTFLRKW